MTKLGNRSKIFLFTALSLITLFFVIGIYSNLFDDKKSKEIINIDDLIVYNSNDDYKQAYLSEMEPIKKSVGYGELVNDGDLDGNNIILTVENHLFTFKKGIFAHANAEVIYDLTNYSDYNYFVAFAGLNYSSSRGDGVTYHFYTSNDNATWTEVGDEITKLPREEATFVSIPLNGATYLRIVIDDRAGNGADHSVLADAKLVTEVNGNFVLESVADFDNKIKEKYNNGSINDELENLILKRELTKRVGQYTINSFYNENDDNKAVINWLLSNKTALNYYILGGTPDGNNYYNSLTQLARLYKAYKDDFTKTEVTKYNTVLGDLYTRMAIALSLTHSQRVALWMQPGAPENQSDAVDRYQIFKELHKNNKFYVREDIDITKWFEGYSVEEMRFVMNNAIDDESILWLNEYVQSKIDETPVSAWGLLTPHPYMAYVWPNYGNPVYYDNENYTYFNDLFSVNGKTIDDYGLTRGTMDHKVYKVWMNFRNKFGTGAVCGGISKTGSNIRTTHGIAATVIGQPGHAALLYYTEDAQGRGYWNIDNNISGWTLSEKGERMLLGWGNGSYARGFYQVIYMTMAQEALNDYENFEKAEKYLMLARAYEGNTSKQEELIRKAIKMQSYNLDAWLELIDVYNNSKKSENEYYALTEEIADNLKYFPLAMYNLTNLVKPKLTSIENSYKFALLQTRTLEIAKNLPNNTADSYTIYQPGAARDEANYLLGKVDNSIASFSFDGFDAGKIVLSSRFDGTGIRFDYSLDGKNTWQKAFFTAEQDHKLQLTSEQIRSINAENDIYVHIEGVDYSEENLFKIDITEGSLLSEIYANDLENRIVGVNLNTEWRYKASDSWTSYSVSSPDLTGNKTVQIRQAATGTTLASPISEVFTFTEDNQPMTRKYVPVSHLSIAEVSSEAVNNGGAALKAIDGNYNTRWHSAWNGTDTNRFITIKLDKPRYISAVEFIPAGGGNGKIIDGTIYGSVDGETWIELSKLNNQRYTNQTNSVADAIKNAKVFEIEEPKEVSYIKIVADNATQGHYMSANGNWFTARAFNLYQDLTKNPRPTAGIGYSTTESTSNRVVARLINPSAKITITNNNGSDTYTFSENGEFTFEFVDELGRTGSATAKVDWIDKSIPTADVNYELDTNNKIIISLDSISEDVYLLDKFDKPINFIKVANKKVSSISYLDNNGNTYKTVEVDENGCITRIIYENRNSQVSNVATYVTIINKGVVTSEEYYDAEGNSLIVTDSEKEILKGLQQSIANPLEYTFEDSGDYEFKMLDKAKNIAYKSIKVDYVDDTIIASDITYDITKLTNKNVVATINPYVFENGQKKPAKMVEGTLKHSFTNNGKYTFKYINESDPEDIKTHTAEVNWIDKIAPKAEIKYTETTDGQVIAELINESENIIVNNNGTNRRYIFNKNGEFIFEIEDMAGNKSNIKAKVDWIKNEINPPKPEEPTKPNEPSESEDSKKPNNSGKPSKPSSTNKPDISDKPDTDDNEQNNNVPDNQQPNNNQNNKPIENNSNEIKENVANHSNRLIIICILLFVVVSLGIILFTKNRKSEK